MEVLNATASVSGSNETLIEDVLRNDYGEFLAFLVLALKSA